VGAFVLALALYVAFETKTLFGLSVIQIACAAYSGDAFSVVIAGAWVGALLLGLIWSIVGWRATLNHVESANGMAACYSAVILAGCWWLLKNGLSPAGDPAIEIGRAVVLAFIASNVVNLYLQLRGLWTHSLPVVRVPRDKSGELRAVIEQQAAVIRRLQAQAENPPALEMERVFKHPGMRRTVLGLLHPDRGKTDAERRALQGLFQTASAYFERIGVR
jgi:hypothetical protein